MIARAGQMAIQGVEQGRPARFHERRRAQLGLVHAATIADGSRSGVRPGGILLPLRWRRRQNGQTTTPYRGSPIAVARQFASDHALALIVALAALLRFATLGVPSYWLDEYTSLSETHGSLSAVLDSVNHAEGGPPLYLLGLWGWRKVFGDGEIAIRSMSVLLGTATVPVAFAAARELASRRAGLFAAALTATSPLMIWYSQEVRTYALLVFLAALSFTFFAYALERDEPGWLWGWAISSVLAFTTHYFAVVLIVPEAVWLLLRGPRVRTLIASAAMGAVGIAVLLLAGVNQQQDKVALVIRQLDRVDRVVSIPQHFLVGLSVPWRVLPVVVGVAARRRCRLRAPPCRPPDPRLLPARGHRRPRRIPARGCAGVSRRRLRDHPLRARALASVRGRGGDRARHTVDRPPRDRRRRRPRGGRHRAEHLERGDPCRAARQLGHGGDGARPDDGKARRGRAGLLRERRLVGLPAERPPCEQGRTHRDSKPRPDLAAAGTRLRDRAVLLGLLCGGEGIGGSGPPIKYSLAGNPPALRGHVGSGWSAPAPPPG